MHCVDFAKAITTVQDIGISDHRVQALFTHYSKSIGNGNLITLSEFLSFYKEQAFKKPDVVRQNLMH